MACFFISYAREDRTAAESLDQALTRMEQSVWWDKELRKGEIWREKITREIYECDACILIVSTSSLISPEVGREAELALGYNKVVIPLMLTTSLKPVSSSDGNGLPLLISGLNWVQFVPGPRPGTVADSVAAQIVKVFSETGLTCTLQEELVSPEQERDYVDALAKNLSPTSVELACLEKAKSFLLQGRLADAQALLNEALQLRVGIHACAALKAWVDGRLWYSSALRRQQSWERLLRAFGEGKPEGEIATYIAAALAKEWDHQREWALERWLSALQPSGLDADSQLALANMVFAGENLAILRRVLEAAGRAAELPDAGLLESMQEVLKNTSSASADREILALVDRELPPAPSVLSVGQLEMRWRACVRRQGAAAPLMASLEKWPHSSRSTELVRAIRPLVGQRDVPSFEQFKLAIEAWDRVLRDLGSSQRRGNLNPADLAADLQTVQLVFKSEHLGNWVQAYQEYQDARRAPEIDLEEWRKSTARCQAETVALARKATADAKKTLEDEGLALTFEGELLSLLVALAEAEPASEPTEPRAGGTRQRVASNRPWTRASSDFCDRLAAARDRIHACLAKGKVPVESRRIQDDGSISLALVPFCFALAQEDLDGAGEALRQAEAALPASDDPLRLRATQILHSWRTFFDEVKGAQTIWRSVASLIEQLRFADAAAELGALVARVPEAVGLRDSLQKWEEAESLFAQARGDLESCQWDAADKRIADAQSAYPQGLAPLAGSGFFLSHGQGFVAGRNAVLERQAASCRAARAHEAKLVAALRHLCSPADSDPAVVVECESAGQASQVADALPKRLADLTSAYARLADALKDLGKRVAEIEDTASGAARQGASAAGAEAILVALGLDPTTGFPPEEEVLASCQRRLEDLDGTIRQAEAALAELAELRSRIGLVGEPALLASARACAGLRRDGVASIRAYRDVIKDVVRWTAEWERNQQNQWDQARDALNRFVAVDQHSPFIDPCIPMIDALSRGVRLAGDLRLTRDSERQLRILRQSDLSHPLLQPFRRRKARLEGPTVALLSRLLSAASRVLDVNSRPTLDLAAWIETPLVPDPEALAPLGLVISELKGAMEAENARGLDPDAALSRLTKAAGRNWIALLAAAGEFGRVRELLPGDELLPHHFAVAVFAALRAREGQQGRDSADESVPIDQARPQEARDKDIGAALGAMALFAACEEYRLRLKGAFPKQFPATNPDPYRLAAELERAVRRLFERCAIPWGEAWELGSWAIRWVIECQAVERFPHANGKLPWSPAWPLGPALLDFCGGEPAARSLLERDPDARLWYGPEAQIAAMLKALRASEALREIEHPANPGSAEARPPVLVLAEATIRADRLRLHAKALRMLLDQGLGPEGPDPVTAKPEMCRLAGEYAGILFDLDRANLAEPLNGLLSAMFEQVDKPNRFLRRCAVLADAELRVACASAIVEELSKRSGNAWHRQEVEKSLLWRKAELLECTALLRFPAWSETSPRDAAVMERMLADINEAIQAAPALHSARLYRLQLLWCQVLDSQNDREQDHVRDEIRKLEHLALMGHWPDKEQQAIRQLLDITRDTQSCAQWLRGLTLDGLKRK